MRTFHVRSLELCQLSSIDRDPPHNVSLFGLLNEGRAVGLPAQLDRITAVALLERDTSGEADEADLNVRVLSPSGMELLNAQSKVPFRPDIRRFRLRFVMDGMVMPEAGVYRFEMEVSPGEQPSNRREAFYELTYSPPQPQKPD